MYFNELRLQESSTAKIPAKAIPFRWLTHHVAEIYSHLLPKIDINGSRLITLEFGAKSKNDVEWDNMMGCTNVFVEDFDFERFYASTAQERELILADEIKRNLLTIYKRKKDNSEDIETIISTVDKAIELGFSLDIPIKKLQKISKDKAKRIEIHRILNAEVGEAWHCVLINKVDHTVIEEKWITQIPDCLNRTDYFKKAEIKGDTYTIYDDLGIITFQINV